ncbi:MAG: hypothetical protein IGS48_12870 [Oscillatoriales cyanobacterium C42_A2020_001]|nr:hypothetical protein [Leptolyngbyaceae cyanobacterium C42_A2020_001]
MQAFAHFSGLVLMCATSASAVWIGASLSSVAYANGTACKSTLESAVTKPESDVVLCKSINPNPVSLKQSLEQPSHRSAVEGAVNGDRADAKVDDFYPPYCPTLSSRLGSDDYLFRQTFERCKYGH